MRKGLENIRSRFGRIPLLAVGVTGSGRERIGRLIGADAVRDEITAQARAAIQCMPKADTVFEIGGQDSKYISLQNGQVTDFQMNKICAAGTDSFVEEQAARMNIPLKDFGRLALTAKAPVELGERCTVFIETAMGEIALHPQESKLVEYIFQQYLAGATYNTLVEELREQSIPYDEGKLWNKNMVARILEDSRYTGERGYPPVIDREALEKALEKRSAKQTAAPKTDTQKLLRRFSGRPSTARMERQVLDLLNGLIISPEQLRLPATAPPDRSTELNLQRELDRVMECQPIDEDAAKALILSIAAAQYSAVDSREYETVRLRRVFSGRQSTTALDAELLQRSVSAIHCHNDGSLNIQLKNGQVIGKE